jgi:hypothetical protein
VAISAIAWGVMLGVVTALLYFCYQLFRFSQSAG